MPNVRKGYVEYKGEVRPLVESISEEELSRGLERGSIESKCEVEWAKDEDGIARPVKNYYYERKR